MSVHKNYENTGGKHQFGPRFALQKPRACFISSGHSPRLGGVNFRLRGHNFRLRGHGPKVPPWRRVCFQLSQQPTKPYLISQKDLNDFKRNLNLTKSHSDLLASRLQQWNLLAPDTKVAF